jgi:lactate dehydrogenase-like 2-hydroxyacid dehydrogenase
MICATMSIVVVTQAEYGRGEEVFANSPGMTCIVAPPQEDALAKKIADFGARHAIVGGQMYRGPLYEALRPGAVVARFGVGHEGIDKAKATSLGLYCTNTPGVLDQSVAELTFLLVAAAARRLIAIGGAMRDGKWTPLLGSELKEKTLVIVGTGRIGRAVGRIARRGYDMRTVGVRRPGSAASTELGEDFDLITEDVAAAFGDADFVCLLIPGVADNTHFINAERLALLRPHVWLINTARGIVVDERALFDALKDGRLAGASLDVFDREPYQPVEPGRDLRMLPNVILTPHVGSMTPEANRGMASRALQNITLAEAGRFDEMDLLNPDVLKP